MRLYIQPVIALDAAGRVDGRTGAVYRTSSDIRFNKMRKPYYEPKEEHCSSPVLFATEVLNVSLWSRQEEVLEALRDHRRVAVKSGNGLGKGFSAAVAILWFLCCHEQAVVLSTAPTFRQVRHVLWREVHRLYQRARYSLGGKLLDTRLEMSEGKFALGLSADTDEDFQGFHSSDMLIVVDEAEGVEETIYEGIESVMTSENCRLLLIGNPTTMSGAFRRAFYDDRELYHTITISAFDSPNVREGHGLVRGLVTRKWVEERKKVWGEENPVYQARVLGEFPDQGEDTLIALSMIEGAVGRFDRGQGSPSSPDGMEPEGMANSPSPSPVEEDIQGPVVVAVDVARFGSDKSVILRRRGMVVEEIKAYRGLDTMKLVGLVVDAALEPGGCEPGVRGPDAPAVGPTKGHLRQHQRGREALLAQHHDPRDEVPRGAAEREAAAPPGLP